MKLKHFILTFLIAFVIFSSIVVLGMEFNWVRFLQPEKPQPVALPESQEVLAQKPEETETRKRAPMPSLELMNEDMIPETQADIIRNDCIRAARRAGVGDADIFRVVDECVAMSQDQQVAAPVGIPAQPAVDSSVSATASGSSADAESLELTREACEMVVNQQQGLPFQEKLRRVEECVRDNLDN